MYYEFYIDVFFLENMILDYVTLLILGMILKRKIRFLRLLLASIFGAAAACLLFIIPIDNIVFTFLVGYIIAAFCMVTIGYGISQKRTLIKGVLLLYGLTFLSGGIYQVLAAFITLPVIMMGILSALVLTLFLKGYQSIKYKAENIYHITVGYHGKSVCIRGLRDTGNQLIDPISKRPVSIISKEAAKPLMDDEMKVFFIPYHSIGKRSGLLQAATFEYMDVVREDNVQRIENPLIAMSEEVVNREGKYQMIVHPQMVDD